MVADEHRGNLAAIVASDEAEAVRRVRRWPIAPCGYRIGGPIETSNTAALRRGEACLARFPTAQGRRAKHRVG
jgi:hypothetical protein